MCFYTILPGNSSILCNFFVLSSSWFYVLLLLLLLLFASFLCIQLSDAVIFKSLSNATFEHSVLNCRGIGIEIYSVIFDVDKFERTAVSQAVVAMTLYAEILQMSAIMTNFGFIRFISLIVSHLYTAK